jgi:hypothetical protein
LAFSSAHRLLTLYTGDLPLLHAARAEARTNFRKNASLQPNDPAVAAAVQHAEEVAVILKQNVVQGKKLDGEGKEDRYSMFGSYFTPQPLVCLGGIGLECEREWGGKAGGMRGREVSLTAKGEKRRLTSRGCEGTLHHWGKFQMERKLIIVCRAEDS